MSKLTQSFVKSITVSPGESQTFYMDDELTGFGLRVSSTKKVFYLQMRVGRKVLKRKLGEYGPMTVDQARKNALQMKAQLLDGRDPYEERHRGASDATLDELFDEYTNEVEHRANTKKSIESAKRHFGELEGMAFKTKPNGRSAEKIELTKVKLPNWLKRPLPGDHAGRCAGAFRCCLAHDPQAQAVEGAAADHAHVQPAFQVPAGGLQLRYQQVPVVARGVHEPCGHPQDDAPLEPNQSPQWLPRHQQAVLREVVAGMRGARTRDWRLHPVFAGHRKPFDRIGDVALVRRGPKKGHMVFRNTKNGQDYTFPIAPVARSILERRLKAKINDFVFGYADSGKCHVVCPPQYHIKLVRVECGEHWSMHDLRRTFTTAMTLLNVHAFTIAHLMKHSMNSSMTLSYAPPTQEQLLEALIRLEQHLMERVRPEACNDVVAEVAEATA
jgi:Phage integrase family.